MGLSGTVVDKLDTLLLSKSKSKSKYLYLFSFFSLSAPPRSFNNKCLLHATPPHTHTLTHTLCTHTRATRTNARYIHTRDEKVWQDVSALCRDFVDKCLNKKPKKRTTAKQAQRHPWIKKAVKAMEGAPLSKGAMLAMMKFQETNLFEK